jgi:hypothetical protein
VQDETETASNDDADITGSMLTEQTGKDDGNEVNDTILDDDTGTEQVGNNDCTVVNDDDSSRAGINGRREVGLSQAIVLDEDTRGCSSCSRQTRGPRRSVGVKNRVSPSISPRG